MFDEAVRAGLPAPFKGIQLRHFRCRVHRLMMAATERFGAGVGFPT